MKPWIAACLACAALAAHAEAPLRVEAAIDPPRPWVQSQAIYRLRVLQSADVRDIRLVGPRSPLAEVRALDAIRVREVERYGHRYRLHEQDFAVFPFASGHIELQDAHVSGRLPGAAATTRWDAPAVALAVQAAPPDNVSGHWLPAHRLTLSEAWSPPDGSLSLNGIARRTIRVEAAGADAAQIPELQLAIPGMQVSALAPRLENRMTGDGFIGVREQDFQLVPLQAGRIAVPALQLSWWKVPAGTQSAGAAAIANLPPRDLEVAGAIAAASTIPATPQHMAFDRLLAPAALLALVAMVLWLIPRVRRHPLWALRRACAGGDPAAARSALLAWASGRWLDDPPHSLPALAARLARDGLPVSALHDLDRRLYGIPREPWQATPVWRLAWRATLRRAGQAVQCAAGSSRYSKGSSTAHQMPQQTSQIAAAPR